MQEALLNVVRHSGSDSAEVRLERHATQVILQIRDRGRGISGARRPEQPYDGTFVGVGIPSMRERLRQNGGQLEILSTDQGTTLVATVPLEARTGCRSADLQVRRDMTNRPQCVRPYIR